MYADMQRPRELTEEQRKIKETEISQEKMASRQLIVSHIIG